MTWIGAISLFIIATLFLYWQLIIAEGAYLGQKVVTRLYDWTAHKYNAIKQFDPEEEDEFLATPLNQALGHRFNGILLDVATGTGRLPIVMMRKPQFNGIIIGVDHSAKMLAVAQQAKPDLPLVLADAMTLPFAHNSVQAVTCLEALEFLPRPVDGLKELVRVLSPGGVLLTTNRIGWEAKLMPGKTWISTQLQSILEQMLLTNIQIIPWLDIYEQVWAKKQNNVR